MAPGTRRAGRGGYAEHDDFEGLPVRQWRQEWVTVVPPEPQEQQSQNDIWAVELIHGMPKDSQLLPNHTQELLRAARSGALYKRPTPIEDEEIYPEPGLAEKPEKKEEDNAAKGFAIKQWKQIPRNVDQPGVSFLATRRRNTVTIASRTVDDKLPIPTVTRATVRRVDAAGNPYTEDVTLVEGQKVVGEIVATRVEAVPAPLAQAQAAMPPPLKRRPPPPKRKARAGPGRGKKKIKTLPLGEGQPVAVAVGADGGNVVKPEGQDGEAPKTEGNDTPNQDSEMADGDDNDEDDDDDDDEDGEDGEDGDEGDEGDDSAINNDDPEDQDKEMTEVVEVAPPASTMVDIEIKDEAASEEPPAPDPLSLAPHLPASPKIEGSPLKNVLVPSPPEDPLPSPSQLPTIPPPPASDIVADSIIAEPPSAIVGESPEEATNRDLPPTELATDEALLPPPPDQVGNISSPKASPKTEEGADRSSEAGDKSRDEVALGEEALPDKSYQSSIVTEDSIKPDDSASVVMPAPGSRAPSEAAAEPVVEGGVVVDEDVDVEVATEAAVVAPTVLKEVLKEETKEEIIPEPVVEEPDLLGGLMGELDRQASEGKSASTEKGPELEVVTPEATAVEVTIDEIKEERPADKEETQEKEEALEKSEEILVSEVKAETKDQ